MKKDSQGTKYFKGGN